ncbi:hypothetical protein MIMGU_mgv1a001858mg [Erythranthe guttata]|uniref:Uncharacterized protein n=1 Tax=Erythranthe guttata TaxID=4155 RepID=A0A022QS56_ERYGU|nr:hypothetical protein MIMGU_mgv1a001858mg [Erythranthe guttata]
MAKQFQSFFLEEWLKSVSIIKSNKNSSAPSSSSSSAQAIIQAWANLRDSIQHQSFDARHFQALKILVSSQAALHVADPQAKLLVSILSSQTLSLPHESYPLFFRLLYIWVRKSRQTSSVLDSAIDALLHVFSNRSHIEKNSIFFSEGILLLGAFSFQNSASDKSKILCLELLWNLLEEEHRILFFSDELASLTLAGAGYALSSSVNKVGRQAFLKDLCYCILLSGLSGSSGFMHVKKSAEDRIETVASDLVLSRTNSFDFNIHQVLLLRFIALALARSGSVSYKPSLLVSLALALVTEVFPLQRIYNKILKFPEENWATVLDEIKDHQSSFIFKDAGAITGVFCNQYASADENSRSTVENIMWDYCRDVYLWHRQARLMLAGRGDMVISEIEKIAESAFLMVVVFALGVTKQRLLNQETQLQTSVRILISFSCMEYFRRMRLAEYMDTIRAVIVSVQESESACVAFVESIPSYNDLINNDGSSILTKSEHLWSVDEVQTARIIFYMRVIPTCVDRLPASVFKKVVAPTMFLYTGHPKGKVARYAHSVFVAFISSGKDPCPEERTELKEQLVFYYIQRSLEGYPEITPFEGMASGVIALVRHLPAGSPSIFYCIQSLVEKASSMCSTVSIDDSDLWKNWEGELESSKKILDLLLRLLALVDIQVLPSLMKSLAQLMVQLPQNGQNMLLNQLYQQIAESDDVIRKPALVSWVQSLSYLCTQGTRGKKLPQLAGDTSFASSTSIDSINARL